MRLEIMFMLFMLMMVILPTVYIFVKKGNNDSSDEDNDFLNMEFEE